MYSSKKAIGILLSIILISTNTSAYSHPENLASNSLFKLWEEKRIDPQEGLIIEARLRAIHSGIYQGRCTPEDLRAIDEEVTHRHTGTESLKKYSFDYTLKSFKDKRIWGMMNAKIYRDKYGYRQLVLFYDPNNPPWDILAKFGVKTKDREFAKRGFWVTHEDTPPDPGRRIFLLTSVALISACVFDPSGLPGALDGGITPDAGPAIDGGPTSDGGPTTDGGTQPINTIEQEVEITADNSNNPVTILPTSEFTSDNTTQRLSPLSQFVRNNNAAFRYNDRDWHWALSETDRSNIINNGLTYVFNGIDHKIKLQGSGTNGRIKTLVLLPRILGIVNHNQPYRLTVTARQIQQLAQQIGLNLETINIHFENLAPTEDFILNGFQKSIYTVVTQPSVAAPDYTSTPYTSYNSPGVNASIISTEDNTLILNYELAAGDTGQYAGISFSTYTMENVALQIEGSSATASSFYPNPIPDFYAPWRAIDGIKGVTDHEWACWGEEEGTPPTPWWQVNLPQPTNIYKIVLYDRVVSPPFDEDLIKGTLIFSDGSTIDIGEGTPYPITPDQGTIIDFPEKYGITWIKLQVTESIGPNPGLSEFEAMGNIPHNNLVSEGLTTIKFNARGNSPFILQLNDNNGEELSTLITGLDPVEFKGVVIDLMDLSAKTNPAFNLENVQSLRILVPDIIVPENGGDTFNGWIEIDGIYKPEPSTELGTRLEYAHTDPDLTPEDYRDIASKLPDAEPKDPSYTIEDANVFEITSWPGILTPDGLNFQIGNRRFSAFHIGNNIYIPQPDAVLSKLQIETTQIEKALAKRNRIILEHELHEIKKWNHKDAVLTEFEENINGLNFADIVTILLGVLVNNDIQTIDINFHWLFIADLLRHGIPLSPPTYLQILKETLGIDISADTYDSIIKGYTGVVITYIGKNGIHTEGISTAIDENKLQNEPGYNEFQKVAQSQPRQGTIVIELDRFFIKNTTLSNAVTIDTEYFRRFIYFAKLLNPNIHLTGITSKPEDNITIRQLLSLLQQHILGFQVSYNVDFSNYQSSQNTVSILTEESAKAIKSPEDIKIIAPLLSDYNRVATTWQEFRVALEGIEKRKQDFMDLVLRIAEAILNELVAKKQITEGEKERLLAEIRQKGIGYIPIYFDPIQYHRSIEQMKSLLIAA